jgi:hypothetical protein
MPDEEANHEIQQQSNNNPTTIQQQSNNKAHVHIFHSIQPVDKANNKHQILITATLFTNTLSDVN